VEAIELFLMLDSQFLISSDAGAGIENRELKI